MEYYRISEVKNYSRKRTKGAWISRYLLWRPFSVYVTWLFANLRVPSVLIVTLSAIIVGVSSFLLFGNSQHALIIGAIGIEVYAFLDHVDGELARFEMRRRGKSNSRVGHYLDLFAHKVSIIAMFAIGWAVANATGNQIYSIISFMLCFFMFGPATESAIAVVTEGKKTEMADALVRISIFSPTKTSDTDGLRPSEMVLFANELIGFPGWLHLITIVCLLDAFVAPIHLLGHEFLYREALLIFLTPLYFAKFAFALQYYLHVMRSIKHD